MSSEVGPRAASPSDPRPKAWPHLAGRLDGGGKVHTLPVRVYYEDTDFSGVAYHASYVRWCERGRSDFLRLAGQDHRGLLDGRDGREPAALMVRRLTVDYLRPARIDDVLEVTTQVQAMGAATLTLKQRIARIDPERPDAPQLELCRAEVMVVLVTKAGRVLRLSKILGPLFGE
jgi:acyl-CoA thioester hydrolase